MDTQFIHLKSAKGCARLSAECIRLGLKMRGAVMSHGEPGILAGTGTYSPKPILKVVMTQAQANEFQMMYLDTGLVVELGLVLKGRMVYGHQTAMAKLAYCIECDYHQKTGFEVGDRLTSQIKRSMRLLAANIQQAVAGRHHH